MRRVFLILQDKYIQLESVPRALQLPYVLQSIGYVSNNPPISEVAHTFPDKIEINLRLSKMQFGQQARMRLGGDEYVLSYPHVVVKIPKTPYIYHELDCRDVFYFCYPTSQYELLKNLGLFSQPLAWNISISAEIDQILARLKNQLEISRSYGSADRLDILCFQLLAELLLMKFQEEYIVDVERETMMRIDSWLRLHFTESVSIEKLAAKNGLSRSSFFRAWGNYFDQSPARHLQDLRLQEACRWLRESRLPIIQIARLVNIPDPAYFCAAFRKKFQQTPKAFRRNFQAE